MISVRVAVPRGKAVELIVASCAFDGCSQAMHGILGAHGHEAGAQRRWLSENGWGKSQGQLYCPEHIARIRELTDVEKAIMRNLDAPLRALREAKR